MYCKQKGKLVIRIKDSFTIATCYDKAHAKKTVDKFNSGNRQGWSYETNTVVL